MSMYENSKFCENHECEWNVMGMCGNDYDHFSNNTSRCPNYEGEIDKSIRLGSDN